VGMMGEDAMPPASGIVDVTAPSKRAVNVNIKVRLCRWTSFRIVSSILNHTPRAKTGQPCEAAAERGERAVAVAPYGQIRCSQHPRKQSQESHQEGGVLACVCY
jgi:hypothetical protein